MKTGKCLITQKEFPIDQLVSGITVRPGVAEMIRADHPLFSHDSLLSVEGLNQYRKKYLEQMLQDERGAISKLESEVVNSIHENELMAENIEDNLGRSLGLGDRIADRIAAFGGSWKFIISFFAFILGWMCINIFFLVNRPFDPYPFILLNLILSCIAAIQAPIIMMSQNRQESRDRLRSEHDYKVNLKAELEIRLLHEKIDHMITQQHQRLLDIQQIQIDLMEDILSKMNPAQNSTNR